MVRRLITAHAVCVAAFVLGQFPQTVAASEAIVPNGGRAFVNWGTPAPASTNYTRFSQTITPLEISTARAYNYFASQHFLHLPGGSSAFVPTNCYKNNGASDPCQGSGFYFGVQPSGVREDARSQGPVALFSMWNASSATAGSESTCGRFDWEGVGYICRLDLDSIAGENAFVVERLSDGRSWRVTIRQSGGQEKVIGTHTFPEVVEATGAMNWMEYYGPATTCGSVPNGWARFSLPEITTANGTVRQMQIWKTETQTCPTAKVLTYVDCGAVILGEGPPLANPPGVCSVRYDGNSPSSGNVPTDSTVYANGATVTVPGNAGSLAKSGYLFDGWCTTPTAAGAACSGTPRAAATTFAISANTTLYAVWAAASQSISYDNNGTLGTISATTGNTGTTVTLNTGSSFTHTGYTLSNWCTTQPAAGAACGGTSYALSASITMPAGGLTLYAVWGYAVVYNGNSPSSGSVPTDSTVYANGATVTVPGNTGSLAKSRYLFDGWCTTPTAAGAACSGTPRAAASTFEISANTTLYAVWKTAVPRQVGKSCTKVGSVRKTPSGGLICSRTSQGLSWQLGK